MTIEERFEKIEAGIRDLIVVSRTVLTSIEELRGAQKHTDEKLDALIQAQTESEQKVSRLADTVDKLVRYRGPNGQGGESSPL